MTAHLHFFFLFDFLLGLQQWEREFRKIAIKIPHLIHFKMGFCFIQLAFLYILYLQVLFFLISSGTTVLLNVAIYVMHFTDDQYIAGLYWIYYLFISYLSWYHNSWSSIQCTRMSKVILKQPQILMGPMKDTCEEPHFFCSVCIASLWAVSWSDYPQLLLSSYCRSTA